MLPEERGTPEQAEPKLLKQEWQEEQVTGDTWRTHTKTLVKEEMKIIFKNFPKNLEEFLEKSVKN